MLYLWTWAADNDFIYIILYIWRINSAFPILKTIWRNPLNPHRAEHFLPATCMQNSLPTIYTYRTDIIDVDENFPSDEFIAACSAHCGKQNSKIYKHVLLDQQVVKLATTQSFTFNQRLSLCTIFAYQRMTARSHMINSSTGATIDCPMRCDQSQSWFQAAYVMRRLRVGVE